MLTVQFIMYKIAASVAQLANCILLHAYSRTVAVPSSGIARVARALGQETFLHPRQQKLQNLKLKIGAKVRKKQKQSTFYTYLALF